MLQTITMLVNEFWNTLAEMSPYLLFGFFMAGLLSVGRSAAHVQRHRGREGGLARDQGVAVRGSASAVFLRCNSRYDVAA